MKQSSLGRAAILGFMVLVAVPFAAPGLAAEGAILEEIVVTAQRRETRQQETPVAVTAFTGEKISDLGIFDVTDISSLAPNTVLRKQPASNSNAGLTIRGIFGGETSLLFDPKASIYIDGAYLSKTVGAVFDVVDLESVEVLRGPQGTLFGRNATGGALNVTTAKPTGEFGARLSASAGNDGYRRYAGSVNLPALGEMLSVKLSGMTMQYDGWATNDYPGQPSQLGSEDDAAFRVALRLRPTDGLTIDYAYDETGNEGVPTPFQVTEVKSSLYNGITVTPFPFAILGGPLYQQMAATVGDPDARRETFGLDANSEEELDVEGHTLTATWDFRNVTLKYIFADRKTTQTYGSTDLDGGAYVSPDLLYGGGMPVPTPGFHAGIPEAFVEMTTHELQAFGELMDGRVRFTVGYYDYEEDVHQDNPQTFGLPIAFLAADPLLGAAYFAAGFCNVVPGVGPLCIGSQRLPIPFPFPGADPNLNGFVDFIYGQNSESRALYGQASYALSDRLRLTGGLRYTDDKKTAYLFNENLGQTSFDQRLVNSRNWDNWSYLATMSFAVNEEVNLYFTHSTGYNAGGFNARATTVSAFDQAVNEEEITAFELGLKADWLNDRLRTNVALYHNDVDDLIIAQFEAGTGGASTTLKNSGKASYAGVELEVVAILTESLIAEVSYGYLDSEFDEYLARDPATDQEVDIADVTTMPGAPEHTANIGLQYDFRLAAWAAASLRFDATYTDEIAFHPFLNQYDSSDGHWLLSARASLKDIELGGNGRLHVSLWAQNIADEEYRNWGIDFGSLGYAGATWGQPRTYGIDFVYEIGN